MSTDVPVVPGGEAPAPAPRKTNWLLIIGIIAGVLIVCTLVFCIGSVVLAPKLGAASTATLCGINYPDLSSDQCSAWADDVWTNHQSEFVTCNNQSQASTSSGDPSELFKCLEDKGIGPKD